MANQLDIELRTWVQRFVDDEISMAELSDWFASATWASMIPSWSTTYPLCSLSIRAATSMRLAFEAR